MCVQADGLVKYGPHNLYLNSASPANQSVTVVSGATYAITITGSVSITWSGARTGTDTAGTYAFTAASGTLTGGSTSGSGTVHVYRTPAITTYLATTASIRYGLPFEWDASLNPLGIRMENAATNLALYSDDFTNAAWTKSNLTTAKTATGADGVANSATTLTATAANATALQAITSGSALRVTSCWIKRRTGSGTINVTQDNGTTWSVVAPTSSWGIVHIPSATATNPTVGIRIVTSGDAVDVMFFQHELNAITSPIQTLGSTVTRAEDNISIAATAFPWDDATGTLYAKHKTDEITLVPVGNTHVILNAHNGTGNERHSFTYVGSGSHGFDTVDGGSSQGNLAGASLAANTVYRVAGAYASNDRQIYTDGVAGSSDAGTTLPTVTTLTLGAYTSTTLSLKGHMQEVMFLPRRMNNTDLDALTTP
jgi:hypothetical protein